MKTTTENSSSIKNYDLIIIGGGMVGITAAIAFAKSGFSIALVENQKIDKTISTPAKVTESNVAKSFDRRAVALSAASIAIYKSLNIWPEIAPIACPIKHISVSDQGHFGFTRLHAEDYSLDALGEVICLEEIAPILWKILKQERYIDVYCPATIQSIESRTAESRLAESEDDYQQITISQIKSEKTLVENKLRGKLLIGADGTYSKIAKELSIPIERKPYPQSAIIANIKTQHSHNNRAFERFTSNGPLALLPLKENWMSLVWCQKSENLKKTIKYSDKKFIEKLQREFGFRLGLITDISQRTSYPLSLHIAKKPFTKGALLLGNSAHTLHPIAGQGFNLGLRDIAVLSQMLIEAIHYKQDFSSVEFLEKFTQARSYDWQQSILATDSLATLFSQTFYPLVFTRNTAMNLVNQIPFIKKSLAKSAMGFVGRSSRLARGLGIEPSESISREKG